MGLRVPSTIRETRKQVAGTTDSSDQANGKKMVPNRARHVWAVKRQAASLSSITRAREEEEEEEEGKFLN